MSRSMTRRRFLKASAASAAAAGFFLTAGTTPAAQRTGDPMRRLNVAVIGCGGRGRDNANGVAGENLVALCDVDSERAAEIFNKYPKVPKYQDFRVMLEKQKDIEAVVVATADHTHAVASMMAINLGKHCYTEKPMTHSVWEARQMRLAAAKNKVATQMGNQHTSDNEFRTAVEIIRSGAIGDVREVHVWTNRPGMWWAQGNRPRPKDRPAVPKHINWDVWLGPAPERPYHSDYHPFHWRGRWDFGTGALGDMGCHTMNMPYMALRLGAPSSVEAECDQEVNNECPPHGLMVTYEYPARGSLPAVRLKWYEVRQPARELFEDVKTIPGSGAIVIGNKGRLYSPSDYGGGWRLWPAADFKGYKPPEPTLPRVKGAHHQEWLLACKGEGTPMSNFDYAGPLTEAVLLGNVAVRVGKRIVWDSEKLRCVDCAAADSFIRREYRKGWGW